MYLLKFKCCFKPIISSNLIYRCPKKIETWFLSFFFFNLLEMHRQCKFQSAQNKAVLKIMLMKESCDYFFQKFTLKKFYMVLGIYKLYLKNINHALTGKHSKFSILLRLNIFEIWYFEVYEVSDLSVTKTSFFLVPESSKFHSISCKFRHFIHDHISYIAGN